MRCLPYHARVLIGSRVLPLFVLQRQACHPRTDGSDQGTGEQLL
jgi:hypothetical protein